MKCSSTHPKCMGRVHGGATGCTCRQRPSADESRREGWELGVRAMARAVMESGIYSAALDVVCEALIKKGPPL